MNTLRRGETMAGASNPGLKWSTYQDKQLGILNSLEKSFTSSLSVSKQIRDSLTVQSGFMDSMLHASNNLATNLSTLTRRLVGHSEDFVAKMHSSSIELDRLYGSVRGASNGLDDFSKETREASDDLNESSEKLSDAFLSAATKLFTWIDKYTDVYKESSNRLMRYTGANLSMSQTTRSDIVDIVEGLNRETGYFFAGDQSYQRLVELSLQANIGSTEALKEVASPLLLAENSMQTDVAKLAELFSKYYIRYNFSSESMESIVGGILTNTADNMADAAKVAAALEGMSDTIAVYAPRDRQEEYLNQASKAVSWASAYAGISEDQAADWIQKIYRGGAAEDDQLRLLLNYGGLDTSQATNLLRSTGDAGSVLEAIVKGAEELGKLSQAQRSELAYSTRGLDINTIEGIIAALKGDSFIHFNQFNPEQIDPESVINDQYVGIEEKFSNHSSTLMEFLASIEEKMGASLKEILVIGGAFAAGGIIRTIATHLSSTGILGKVADNTGSKGILGKLTGAGGGSLLGSIGTVLGVGAVAGSVAVLIKGLYDGLKEAEIIKEKGAAATLRDTEGGFSAGSTYGFTYTGDLSDPNTGLTPGLKYDKSSLISYYQDLATELYEKAGYDLENDNILEVLGKSIVGPGWFSGGKASLIDYIPFIGGAYRGITTFPKQLQISGNVKSSDAVISYLNSMTSSQANALTAFHSLYPNISKSDQLARLNYFIDNESRLLNLYSDPEAWEAAYKSGKLKGYATGSNYIPYDQLAYIHEGEAVVPKKYNPYAQSSELDTLRERSERLQEESNDYYNESISTLKEIRSSLEDIKRIREFLSYWRNDNIRRETIAESRKTSSEMAYARGQVSGYLPLQY